MSKISKRAITGKQLRKRLKRDAKIVGSMSAWANDHGMTPQAVSAFVRGTQGAGLQIPEALGYRPETIYVPVKR